MAASLTVFDSIAEVGNFVSADAENPFIYLASLMRTSYEERSLPLAQREVKVSNLSTIFSDCGCVVKYFQV
jgi:hypothetical protein